MTSILSRRRFLHEAGALSACSLFGLDAGAATDPPPETRKIRLIGGQGFGPCLAPQYLAEELLRLEGFTDIEYDKPAGGATDPTLLTANQVDITAEGAPVLVQAIDRGQEVVVLAGIHAGCYDLVGNERVRSVRDLAGRDVAVVTIGAHDHVFLASMVAYVGIDPRTQVNWIATNVPTGPKQAFLDGKADAFLAFAPGGLDVRAKRFGRVLLSTTLDRPWSQYFCCMATARREFVRNNPVATKRALRALLKAADICAQEPERAARYLVEKGYESDYSTTLQVLKELPYDRWRTANPADTLRFHALRLREGGIVRSTPEKLIAQGTDWRFLNELKKELKA
jgi:NitT/TauT family transport system substrate-binding protein